MDIEAKLAELADEHLATMSKVSWDALAASIRQREPAKAGETFGCVIDGTYFDVGDSAEWVAERGGDIRLTTFAYTRSKQVERTAIIKRSK